MVRESIKFVGIKLVGVKREFMFVVNVLNKDLNIVEGRKLCFLLL